MSASDLLTVAGTVRAVVGVAFGVMFLISAALNHWLKAKEREQSDLLWAICSFMIAHW